MVSSTPCWPRMPDALRALLRRLRLGQSLLVRCMLALLLSAVALPAAAQVRGPAITDVRFDAGDDGIRMSGNVRFTLSDKVRETLERGVPVYFLFETQTTRDRWYWSGKVVHANKRYIRLLYQPLTRRWRINVSGEPFNRGSVGVMLNQNFDSLDAALGMVRRISSWHVLDAGEWSADNSYVVRARLRMDVSQLGQPFQIGTVGQAGWSLDVERIFPITAQDLGKTVSGL